MKKGAIPLSTPKKMMQKKQWLLARGSSADLTTRKKIINGFGAKFRHDPTSRERDPDNTSDESLIPNIFSSICFCVQSETFHLRKNIQFDHIFSCLELNVVASQIFAQNGFSPIFAKYGFTCAFRSEPMHFVLTRSENGNAKSGVTLSAGTRLVVANVH